MCGLLNSNSHPLAPFSHLLFIPRTSRSSNSFASYYILNLSSDFIKRKTTTQNPRRDGKHGIVFAPALAPTPDCYACVTQSVHWERLCAFNGWCTSYIKRTYANGSIHICFSARLVICYVCLSWTMNRFLLWVQSAWEFRMLLLRPNRVYTHSLAFIRLPPTRAHRRPFVFVV